MLRTDGKFEIYVLEFRSKKEREVWHSISFDVAWVPSEFYKKEVWDEFSASGKCWQETGVHGTYDVEVAIKLYVTLIQHSIKDYIFRVVKKTIRQESEILWCGMN